MSRPAKRSPEAWKTEILGAAQTLFLSKGYEKTSVCDIMDAVGAAKGMFYRCFAGKEDLMSALGDRMFFANNPFEAVRGRADLSGLQKMREVLRLNRADARRAALDAQSVSLLQDPRILSEAVAANRRILTPLWLELLEEGRRDGSIQTEYPRELSELLAVINFWFLPAVYPASPEEIRHKFQFAVELFTKMGLPLHGGAAACGAIVPIEAPPREGEDHAAKIIY